MSKRSERREEERAARKLAYKELRQQRSQTMEIVANATSPLLAQPEMLATLVASEPVPTALPESTESVLEPEACSETEPTSDAQLNANRANSQFSTGPTTPEGKARSSMNALKHALTGQTVFLPHEDAAQYQRELDNYFTNYQPATIEEIRLVQCLHDCAWRISRIQRLESGILLKGHIELAGKFEDRSAVERAHLIQAEAYLKYERQLRNLNIQEARLNRTAEKARLELARLKAVRRQQEQAELRVQQLAAKTNAAQPNGFVFSPSQNTPPTNQSSTPINRQNARSRTANTRNA